MKQLIFAIYVFSTLTSMGQGTKEKDIDQADKKLVELMFFGLDHGVESVKVNGKGSLIPFIVLEKNGSKQLKRFVADKLEDGLNEAITFLKTEKEADFAVIIFVSNVGQGCRYLHAYVL